MTEKKKQHFVPRFYLRNFSLNAEGKKISLFNFAACKYVSCSNLYDQAYKNYFYGEDLTIEDALADLEKEAAKIINSTLLNDTVPMMGSDEHHILLVFIMFLRQRTVYAADELNEAFDKIMKSIASEDPKAPPDLERFNFVLTQPVQQALANTASVIPLALDLKFKLIINRTAQAFITSDHPVVFYNQFLEPRKIPGGKTGIACKGLEVFLPLSPTHLLILFDSDVYKVGTKNSALIHVTNETDVEKLNILQCINADKNLYFNQTVGEDRIRQLVKQSSRFRRQIKVDIDKQLQKDTEGQRTLIMTHTSELSCSLSLSFISLVKKARRLSLGNKLVHVRDENFVRCYRNHNYDLDAMIADLQNKNL